jgi:hypothetical protein
MATINHEITYTTPKGIVCHVVVGVDKKDNDFPTIRVNNQYAFEKPFRDVKVIDMQAGRLIKIEAELKQFLAEYYYPARDRFITKRDGPPEVVPAGETLLRTYARTPCDEESDDLSVDIVKVYRLASGEVVERVTHGDH